MESIKHGIYLVLLIAGTSLGCAIIERELNESREHLNLPAEPNEVDSFEVNDTLPVVGGGPVAGTTIDGAKLSNDVLKTILDAMGKVERKIAVGIENRSGKMWEALNVYFYSGTSDVTMPPRVDTGKALLYDARKTSRPVRGAVGVMAYYIPDLRKTMAVMFSVPFHYKFYGTWWNVNMFPGKTSADKRMFETMYKRRPYRGNNRWYRKSIGSGLQMAGSMAGSGMSTLEIHVMA